MRLLILVIILSCTSLQAQKQQLPFWKENSNLNVLKKSTLITGESLFYLYFTYASSQRFFKDYPYSPLHFKNDANYWRGMDKGFHSYFNYSLNKGNYELYRLAGFNKKQALLYSTINTSLIMTTKEWIDGHIDVGGFSVRDIIANTAGSGLFTLQKIYFDHQFLKMKYSFNPFGENYHQYNPTELGYNIPSRMFRNYNEMTFWLSINPSLFIDEEPFPISIALGYSANGLLSSQRNEVIEYQNGLSPVDRISHYYLSIDIDFEAIKTDNKALKVVFFCLDHIKVPLPGVGFNSKGQFKAYPLLF